MRRAAPAGSWARERKASSRWALLRREAIATPIPAATSPIGDEERPERHGSGEVAGDDERSEDDRACGAERGEGAAGRPEALLGRQDAGEEPDAEGVPGAEGDDGVDERADPVARAGVGDREAAAAEADRAAPGSRRGEDGDREADPGEPEPGRVGGADGVECGRDARAEELGRRDRREQGEQQESSCGEAAATDSVADLGERQIHVPGLLLR